MAQIADVISNGIHYLSGIGDTTFHDDWSGEDIDVNLFCIDGVVYGAYTDPDDGYRSYGKITAATDIVDCKCQYTFPPQKVVVENIHEHLVGDEPYDEVDRHLIVIKDAILDKPVLTVGTDYTDSYYPMAIFDYQPMNLYANVERQAYGYVS